MRDQRFLSSEHHDRLTVAREAEPLLDALAAVRHTHLPPPIERMPTGSTETRGSLS